MSDLRRLLPTIKFDNGSHEESSRLPRRWTLMLMKVLVCFGAEKTGEHGDNDAVAVGDADDDI